MKGSSGTSSRRNARQTRTLMYGMGTIASKGIEMFRVVTAPVVELMDWYANVTWITLRLASKPTVLMKLAVPSAACACAFTTASKGPAVNTRTGCASLGTAGSAGTAHNARWHGVRAQTHLQSSTDNPRMRALGR